MPVGLTGNVEGVLRWVNSVRACGIRSVGICENGWQASVCTTAYMQYFYWCPLH